MAQAWGGEGEFGIGCKYFAYCLIKHKQTSEFGQWFLEYLLCAGVTGGGAVRGQAVPEEPLCSAAPVLDGFRPGRDIIRLETSDCGCV